MRPISFYKGITARRLTRGCRLSYASRKLPKATSATLISAIPINTKIMTQRDDFDRKTIEAIGKRASFICSNPDCKSLTLCPSAEDEDKFIYIDKAAHITAAAEGGPKYDSNE